MVAALQEQLSAEVDAAAELAVAREREVDVQLAAVEREKSGHEAAAAQLTQETAVVRNLESVVAGLQKQLSAAVDTALARELELKDQIEACNSVSVETEREREGERAMAQTRRRAEADACRRDDQVMTLEMELRGLVAEKRVVGDAVLEQLSQMFEMVERMEGEVREQRDARAKVAP